MPVQQLELVNEPGDHRLHPAHLQPTERGRCGVGRDLRHVQRTYTWGVDTSGGRTASGLQSALHARRPAAPGKRTRGCTCPARGRAQPVSSPMWLMWHHPLKSPQSLSPARLPQTHVSPQHSPTLFLGKTRRGHGHNLPDSECRPDGVCSKYPGLLGDPLCPAVHGIHPHQMCGPGLWSPSRR